MELTWKFEVLRVHVKGRTNDIKPISEFHWASLLPSASHNLCKHFSTEV